MGSAVVDTTSVPLSAEPSLRVHVLFQAAWADFAFQLKRSFFPHLIGGVGLFVLVSYVTACTLFATWPGPFKWIGVGVLFVCYGGAALCYSFFTACVYALRLACVRWNDFIDDILELVQQQTAKQVADMNVGLSKPQAASLVRGSVRDVFVSLRQTQAPGPRWVLLAGLGCLAVAVRAVLRAKILKWTGRTVQLGKLFAGRATLVGAVFLNLHFFATVLLCACYALGAAVLAVNIYFVFLLK